MAHELCYVVSIKSSLAQSCPVTSLSPFVVAELAQPPKLILQDLLNDLKALRGTVTDKRDRQKFDEIIEELRDALDVGNWLDQTHLKPRGGEEVFEEIRDAIEKLGGLMRDRKSTIADAVLQDFINHLPQQSRLLAQTAIIDATTAQTNSRRLAEALEELTTIFTTERGNSVQLPRWFWHWLSQHFPRRSAVR